MKNLKNYASITSIVNYSALFNSDVDTVSRIQMSVYLVMTHGSHDTDIHTPQCMKSHRCSETAQITAKNGCYRDWDGLQQCKHNSCREFH